VERAVSERPSAEARYVKESVDGSEADQTLRDSIRDGFLVSNVCQRITGIRKLFAECLAFLVVVSNEKNSVAALAS